VRLGPHAGRRRRIAVYEALAPGFQAAMMAAAGHTHMAQEEQARYTPGAVRRDWGGILRGEEAPPAA
jgi:hypothetical protein